MWIIILPSHHNSANSHVSVDQHPKLSWLHCKLPLIGNIKHKQGKFNPLKLDAAYEITLTFFNGCVLIYLMRKKSEKLNFSGPASLISN